MLTNKLTTSLTSLALATSLLTGSVYADEVLHLYNWSDYIAEDTIANFEAETGIKVIYCYRQCKNDPLSPT